MNHPTEQSFLNDIKDHSLHIKFEGPNPYRHIICSNGTFDQRFEIITSPNLLTFTGDMGTFVFSRTEDMFNFFRRDRLEINSQYWGEKCIAEDVLVKKSVWDQEEIKKSVLSHIRDHYDLEEKDEVTEELIEDSGTDWLLHAQDEWDFISAYREYSGPIESFQDFFDGWSGKTKSYHFIWALYAIVWAIQEYDKVKRGDSYQTIYQTIKVVVSE